MLVISSAVFLISKAFLGRSKLGAAPRPKGIQTEKLLTGLKGWSLSFLFLGTFLIASLPH